MLRRRGFGFANLRLLSTSSTALAFVRAVGEALALDCVFAFAFAPLLFSRSLSRLSWLVWLACSCVFIYFGCFLCLRFALLCLQQVSQK